MSRAESIREYLRNIGATTEAAAVSRPSVRAALGITARQANAAFGDLKRAGYIAAVGSIGARRYYATGKVRHVPMTDEEFRTRERARQIAIRRAAGCVLRAEYEAACAAKRARKAEERKAAALRREQERAMRRAMPNLAMPKPQKSNVRRENRADAARAIRAREIGVSLRIQAPPAPVRLMTSDEWVAQGGTVERIASGVVSPAASFKRLQVAA